MFKTKLKNYCIFLCISAFFNIINNVLDNFEQFDILNIIYFLYISLYTKTSHFSPQIPLPGTKNHRIFNICLPVFPAFRPDFHPSGSSAAPPPFLRLRPEKKLTPHIAALKFQSFQSPALWGVFQISPVRLSFRVREFLPTRPQRDSRA